MMRNSYDDELTDAPRYTGMPFLTILRMSNRPPTASGIRFLCQQDLLAADEAHAVLAHFTQLGTFNEPMTQKHRDLQAALVKAARPFLRLVAGTEEPLAEIPAMRSLKLVD